MVSVSNGVGRLGRWTALLILVVLFALLWQRPAPRMGPTGDREVLQPTQQPTPEFDVSPTCDAERTDAQSAADRRAERQPAPSLEDPRFLVRGTVGGCAREGAASIVVFDSEVLEGRIQTAIVSESCTCVLDVTPWSRPSSSQNVSVFHVGLEVAGVVIATQSVQTADFRQTLFDGHAARVANVEFVMPDLWTLSGTVRRADGVEAANVAVVLVKCAATSPNHDLIAAGVTNGSGRFRLATNFVGDAMLIIDEPTHRLYSARLTFSKGTDEHVGDVQLESGEILSGYLDSPEARTGECEVWAHMAAEIEASIGYPGTRVLGWRGDEPLRHGLRATVARDGAFEFHGLEPRTYRLEYYCGSSTACVTPLPAASVRPLVVPQRGVALTPLLGTVSFRRASSERTRPFSVTLGQNEDSFPCSSGNDGRVLWSAVPNQVLRYSAKESGIEIDSGFVQVPGPGGFVEVTLRSRATLSERVFWIRSKIDGCAIPAVQITLSQPGGHVFDMFSVAEDGVHRVFAPAGTYDVRVHDSGYWNSFRSLHSPHEYSVDFGVSDADVIPVELVAGGCVEVRTTPEKSSRRCRLSLTDAAGRALEFEVVSLVNGRPVPSKSPLIRIGDLVQISPGLAPGEYRIVARSLDYGTEIVQTLMVRAGERTRVEFNIH